MNESNQDDFEEVESPFAPRSVKAAPRERLRNRKNVFNRPFATDSSIAPAVFETTSTRRSVGHPDQSEMIERRSSSLAQTQIDYLDEEEEDEEEEVVERRPARISSSRKTKAKKNILPKIGWVMIGLLVLRLICMDRGVWDYFATEKVIKEKQEELRDINTENRELKAEINRISLDKNYQRQLAKEHLGVIAVDEFLILFAGESSESNSTTTTPSTHL
jgi:cell division protein FtsB